MAETPEAEVEEASFEIIPGGYPDLEDVPLDERRRVWALTFIMEAGKAAASAAAVVKEAKVIEEYLAGKGPALTVAKG